MTRSCYFFLPPQLLLCCSLQAFPAVADELPNILIIYSDDVGYGDLGCYGADKIDTPNLNKLARGGLRFTSAYATASTCTPSRYSLLTGEYAFRNQSAVVLPGNAPLIIDPDRPTLASVLKSHGYATGIIGKWHLGLGTAEEPLDWNRPIAPGPCEVGFEYSFHMAATGDRVPTVFIENGLVVRLDPEDPIEVSYTEPVGDEPTGLSHPHLLRTQADQQHAKTIVNGVSRIGYMSGGSDARWSDEEMPDEFLQAAVDYIESQRESPFFLLYSTHECHVPRVPHPRFREASGLGVRGDAVVQLDAQVGTLMATLERLGQERRTLVIFSSDNGPVLFDGYYDGAAENNRDHMPAGPFRGGKYTVWEGGTRVPLIVSWPGKLSPGLSDALISQVDLFASLAAVVGAELPSASAADSRDCSDALLGRSQLARDHLVQQGVRLYSLRQGPWKYVPPGEVTSRRGIGVYQKDRIAEPGALYYLPEDSGEQRNLANAYPEIAKRLQSLLENELRTNVNRTTPSRERGATNAR